VARYIIGDVQGCLAQLKALLKKIDFNADRDQLYFVGDLVNRGPDSLGVLKYLYQRRDNVESVLGNHDLHLLAVAAGTRSANKKDTLEPLLAAKQRHELLSWLKHRPMALYLQQDKLFISHAGLYPYWKIKQALTYASEVQDVLRSNISSELFKQMYSDKPEKWSESLLGWPRLIFIINALTRMRFINKRGGLDLQCKLPLGMQSKQLMPWFELLPKEFAKQVVFGHWAALEGKTNSTKVIATDTGCVWGGKLTAYSVEKKKLISVK